MTTLASSASRRTESPTKVLRRHFGIAAATFLVVWLAVSAAAFMMPVQYTVNATVQVYPVAGGQATNATNVTPVNVSTEARVAASDVVMARAAAALGNLEISTLRNSVKVEAPDGSQNLVFRSSTKSATTAAERANAVAEAYLAERGEMAAAIVTAADEKLRSMVEEWKKDPQLKDNVAQLQLSRADLEQVNTVPGALVDPADAAQATATGRALMGVAAGFVLGLIAAAAAVLWRDRTAPNTYDASRLAARTGQEVLDWDGDLEGIRRLLNDIGSPRAFVVTGDAVASLRFAEALTRALSERGDIVHDDVIGTASLVDSGKAERAIVQASARGRAVVAVDPSLGFSRFARLSRYADPLVVVVSRSRLDAAQSAVRDLGEHPGLRLVFADASAAVQPTQANAYPTAAARAQAFEVASNSAAELEQAGHQRAATGSAAQAARATVLEEPTQPTTRAAAKERERAAGRRAAGVRGAGKSNGTKSAGTKGKAPKPSRAAQPVAPATVATPAAAPVVAPAPAADPAAPAATLPAVETPSTVPSARAESSESVSAPKRHAAPAAEPTEAANEVAQDRPRRELSFVPSEHETLEAREHEEELAHAEVDVDANPESTTDPAEAVWAPPAELQAEHHEEPAGRTASLDEDDLDDEEPEAHDAEAELQDEPVKNTAETAGAEAHDLDDVAGEEAVDELENDDELEDEDEAMPEAELEFRELDAQDAYLNVQAEADAESDDELSDEASGAEEADVELSSSDADADGEPDAEASASATEADEAASVVEPEAEPDREASEATPQRKLVGSTPVPGAWGAQRAGADDVFIEDETVVRPARVRFTRAQPEPGEQAGTDVDESAIPTPKDLAAASASNSSRAPKPGPASANAVRQASIKGRTAAQQRASQSHQGNTQRGAARTNQNTHAQGDKGRGVA